MDETPALNVFPNPTNHCLTFEVENADMPFSVTLFDVAGKIIPEHQINGLKKTIDISGLPTGAYLYVPSNEFNAGIFVKN